MAHPDLDELLNEAWTFADQMLTQHREFYPFGFIMSQTGEVSMVGAHDGNKRPDSSQLVEMLTGAFRQQTASGGIRAAVICYDVRIVPPGQRDKTDAICMSLEHQGGDSADACIPYQIGRKGKVTYGETFAYRRERQFFV